MSGRGGILANRMLSTPRPTSARTGPDPTFLEGMSASFRIGQADRVGDDEQEYIDAYSPLVEALTERGMPLTRYVHAARGAAHPINEERVWEDIAQIRARDPGAFAGVAANREGFRAQVMERYKAKLARDADTTSRSGIVPTLIGGVGAAMTDPVNLGLTALTGGAGAGRTAAQTILREVVLNAGVEAAQQPLVAGQRARTGRTLTAGEAAANVALGGIAGGALKGAELGARAGVPAAVERTIAGVWDYLPERVRQRWANHAAVPEAELADLAELTVGRENLTESEAAAVGFARRQAEIDATSPFVGNGAGAAMHRQRIGDAVSAILADVPDRVATPRPAPTPTAALRDTGTAIGSGTIAPRLPRETVKGMIGRAESPSDVARNPKSSATGRYQFTRDTFVAYHRRVFGGNLSDSARWSQATDGAVQERLMDALLADNSAFLKRQGEAETAGNLYLVHFAGQGGAKRIFDADPATPIERLLSAEAIAANGFLRGKTAGDVIAWAHSRMGGPAPARAGARAELAIGAGEASVRDRLQAEIDAIQAQALASEREAPTIPDVAETVAERGAATPEPAGIEAADLAPPQRTADVPEPEPGAMPERFAEREIADTAADDTVLPAPIEDAGRVEPLVRAPKKRTPVVRKRPSDVIEYLADRGGIRDDEGHNLRNGRDMGRVFVPRAGPLIRKNGGLSIDEAGELLWEAGFFVQRPSEADVLDVLDRAVTQGEKIYQLHEQGDMDARALDAEQLEQIEAAIAGLPDDFPLHPERDREAILDVIEEMHETGADALDALARVIEQRVENARARAYEDAGDVDFEPIGPDLDTDPLRDLADAGQDGDASGAVRGTADGGGGPGALEPLGRGEAPELSEAHARAFDDPDGDAARAQVESSEHDLRMMADAVDPAIAERQRQQAQLKAASPMQAATDQEGTIGLGLFDATDQERFRFDDGEEGTLRELFEDLDGEAADIDTLRACLPPAKGNDA